jgi:hypothetical protein
MKLPLRIAILECDSPPDGAKEKLGGYGPIFRTLLLAAADSLGYPGLSAKRGLELTYWDVVNEPDRYPDPSDIDAVLLSGASTSLAPKGIATNGIRTQLIRQFPMDFEVAAIHQ